MLTWIKVLVRICCFFSFIFFARPAYSTIRLQSISGASSYTGSGTTYNIFAGFAYDDSTHTPSTYGCSTSPCNTCINTNSANQYGACNLNSVFVNGGSLQLSVSTDNSAATSSNWYICDSTSSSSNKLGSIFTSTTQTNSQLIASATWSAVCGMLSNGSACSTSGVSTMSIGFGSSCSNLTEKIDLTVYVSYRVGYTTMAESSSTGGANGFSVFPGDGKLYIQNFTYYSGYPATDVSSLKWTGLYFFWAKNATPYRYSDHSSLISVNSSGTAEKDYVNGLENGVNYCFSMASVDATGNILNFTTLDSSKQCGTPQEVVGLLTNKKCFIATAAYGSNLDPHVTTFRKFRNEYLIKSDLGRSFVKTYYQLSPPLADWISEREWARTFTRAALWPLLAYIELTLTFGLFISTLIVFIFIFVTKILLNRFYFITKTAKISLGKTSPASKFSMILCFLLTGSVFFGSTVFCSITFAQTLTSGAEDPMDRPPQEPPYTKIENEFDNSQGAINLNETLKSQQTSSMVNPTAPAATTVTKSNDDKKIQTSEKSQYIQHPNAKKGLYLIDSNGVYHYKTEQLTKKNQSFSFKIGSMPVPQIKSKLDNGSTFSFSDVYGGSNLTQVQIDYEFKLFKKYSQLMGQFGLGFFTATGSGFFKSGTTSLVPKESYTIYGLPLSLGVSYRFEFANRQWLAPYLAGGGLYYGFIETRDDGRNPKGVGAPGGYGTAGALLNLTSWDKDLRFKLDREYGIHNMWINAEYKYVKTTSEELDIGDGYFAAGITIDY